MTTRRALARTVAGSVAVAALLLLAACGGGGGGGGAGTPPPTGDATYDDPQAYSTAPGAALAGAEEAAAVTRHRLAAGGRTLAYTARAGHLIARDPASGAAEASVFYVAYTVDGADGAAVASRPVTFFYNGGPGSATVWLHLGSFAPRRLATGVPRTDGAQPFPFVDNAETLLDQSDLVFVDAPGTGLSEAIAPFTNASFWGVDSDAALFRDAIVRWLAANGRGASPLFLYGESYGGPRTAVLARRLQDAGVMVDGLVLQSPALDYHSNCGISGRGDCSAVLPTYGAIGAWHGRANAFGAFGSDLDAYLATLRGFTADRYAPAVAAWLDGASVPADLPPLLAGYTGIAASLWQREFDLAPSTFQANLLAGALTGRYDGRMSAPVGSALAAEGDPSSTWLTASFASGIAGLLRDTLGYTTRSTYVLLSQAIAFWNFAHAGRTLPDTVPDLAAALAQNPALRVLAIAGYHDLATPFRVTELDLARLGGAVAPRVQIRDYPGGHMSYLDDATRVRQRADVGAFYRDTLALRAPRAAALALRPRPPADRAGTPPTRPQPAVREPALQAPLRDPWVPPR